MTAQTTLTFEVTMLGDLVTGVWCPHCALPSAYAAIWMVRTAAGKGSGHPQLAILQKCTDCGAES